MIINCFRCGKKLDTPNEKNADYVRAQDTIVKEPRGVLIALKHNEATLAKLAQMEEIDGEGNPKYPDVVVNDNEYDALEIPSIEASKSIGEGLVKVVAEIREKDIQKTGVICPDCHQDADFVIWGIHKGS